MTKLEQMRIAFAGSFMQPQAFLGEDVESELMEGGLDIEHGKVYCRLSADGFLDCTEWSGPFDSLEDAAQHLMETYAND